MEIDERRYLSFKLETDGFDLVSKEKCEIWGDTTVIKGWPFIYNKYIVLGVVEKTKK